MAKKRQLSYDAWGVISDSISHTPDFRDLKKGPYDEFPIFVIGNLRKYRAKNLLLDGCNYYGEAVTFNDNFIMKRASHHTGPTSPEPICFSMEKKKKSDWEAYRDVGLYQHQMKHIEGDVYGVPLRKLCSLDKYEGNGDLVERISTWVTLQHPSQNAKRVKAFIWTVSVDEYRSAFTGSESSVCKSFAKSNTETGEFYDVYYHE